MNKKGEGMILMIIMATVLVILIASLLIPQVKMSTTAQTATESLVHDTAPSNANFTLTKASSGLTLEDDSLVIAGLTVSSNYTVNYTSGIVSINTTTSNGTYSAVYGYYTGTYLDDASERILFGVVVIAGIIFLLLFVFRAFGVMD